MTSAEEFNCILCKETFNNKDELQIHFRKHGDPKFNESIKTKSRVQNEATFANEKSNDASELVNCDVCDEVFPTISKAITHKHKVHPEHDAKYFCPWCGKLFTMKHLYNKHLHVNHDVTDEVLGSKDSNFHCDTCNVYFFVPAAMVYHNKFFHRQDSDLPIIGHSKKQALVNQDLLPVYYCSFCGEEYINKVNLHKHMCDDHGDENQRPTDVLRCPLCEAVFYHLDAYELHLTFHSSQDLYSESNEMNEKELTEFSLETVPPIMERIEDLNNLPDVDTDVNAVGIENFLQMAMDEPKDQLPEKARSKKHKKHKKSKKPAITLDEFLSMNQDVFGEDLDFQGIEEVPTKVITKQLKIKKPSITKAGAKMVSSADLQKLQKLGIAVKVQSGSKPPVSKVKPIGQPIKVKPQVKNLAIKTKTKAISASNEVLSKLINQSSNQLKIVKKSIQEKEPDNETDGSELVTENLKDKTETTPSSNEKEQNGDDHKLYVTHEHVPEISPANSQDSNDINNFNRKADGNDELNKKTDKANSNLSNNACSQPIKSPNVNHNEGPAVSTGSCMSDTLKNIRKQITIKPISQAASLPEGTYDNLATQKINESNDERDQICTSKDLNAEKIDVNEKNKAIDTLKSLNSAITIKALKNVSVPGSNISTTNNDKTEKNFKSPDSSHLTQMNLEANAENINKLDKIEPSVQMTSHSQILKNISKNITIKSTSPQIQYSKDYVSNDEHDDSDFDNIEDDTATEKQSNYVVSSASEKPTSLSSGHTFNSDVRIKICPKENVAGNEMCTKDKEFKNASQSNNHLLKHLTNITAKPVSTSKNVYQEIVMKSSNKVTNVTKETNVFRKPMQTQDVNQEIEIFNIDDSDDEEAPKTDKLEATHMKKQSIKADIKSHTVLNAIKNMNKHVTVKPSNKQTTLNKVKSDESITNQFSKDDMHNDEDFDFNDDLEQLPAAHTSKLTSALKITTNKTDSFNNVLKQLGKHITVKSKNASPNQSVKSINHASQDFNSDTAGFNEAESDEEPYTGKVKITDITEDDDGIGHINNCNNEGIVSESPDNSISGDEHFTEEMEETDECYSQNLEVTLNQNLKPNNAGLLKNISKNITVKSLSEKSTDTEDKAIRTVLADNDSVASNSKLCKELLSKPNKQIKSNVTNESEKSRTSNMLNCSSTTTSSSNSPSVHPKLSKPAVVNTVNKEVKVKTFQSQTVIEEITTTVTKTIRRVNQTVTNQQVFNANQISTTPRMIKPHIGPRMGGCTSNNLQGVTVRHSTPVAVRPKIRQAVPLRPASGTVVRASNQLVPIRAGVTPIRSCNAPRMQIKNIPRQPRPVGRPLKISPSVVNQTLKRPVNEEQPGHFSCFKKPRESLIPVNEDPSSNFQFASSSQMSKSCSTTQTVKGNSVVTSTQIKSESLSQQQQINRLGNITGLKVAKASQVSRVEKTEMNASKRTTLEAIEKLQKQGLLVKKPRVEENSDLPYTDGEDHEPFNDEYDE